jgi:C4-dicarboxylate-specific signal transduction histidine kinase
MARGWESKSVEDQLQQAQTTNNKTNKAQLTPSQLVLRRQREILLLSRARVEHQLEAAQDPRYREQLNRALADINERIKSSFPEAASATSSDSQRADGDA